VGVAFMVFANGIHVKTIIFEIDVKYDEFVFLVKNII